jgi:hypothetical protein
MEEEIFWVCMGSERTLSFEHLDGSPEAERMNVQEKPAEGIRNRNDVSNQSSGCV